MRVHSASYHLNTVLAAQMPGLRPAQREGLVHWVQGTILANSSCQSAVATALSAGEAPHRWRQYLREWLYDGTDRASPCRTSLDVSACFAPLLGWVLRWWQGEQLALAIDATYQRDRWVVLSVNVLYRGSAIPVAWQVVPANTPAAWVSPICTMLDHLAGVIPASLLVIVLTDRGLWSPRIWRAIQRCGWHPVMRVRQETTFAPVGCPRQAALQFVPGPGYAWIGRGVAFDKPQRQRIATLLVVWEADQETAWLLLTDLDPAAVGVSWYGLRCWIELSYRQCKRAGWNWHRTRRSDPVRIARHWLVLAVATLWSLAYGTRLEDAERHQCHPAHLRRPQPPRSTATVRACSVFARGLIKLRHHLLRGGCWRRLWLTPDAWPEPPHALTITIASPPDTS